MDAVILVDGRNFVFRHHYPNKGLSTQDGKPTSVLHGCLSGLLSLANRLPDIPIVFVWDGGGNTWRHRLLQPSLGENTIEKQTKAKGVAVGQVSGVFLPSLGHIALPKPKPEPVKVEGYKATRDMNATAQMLDDKKIAVKQIPELMSLLELLGIRSFKITNLEGDDLIGILTTALLQRKIFEKVIIHSTDKDFYQLISKEVSVLKGIDKGQLVWARREEIPLQYGINVEEWVKYRALVGDKSDNIPNFLTGVGPVTAVKWMRMGLDPSVKRFEDLPYLVKQQLKTVKLKGKLIDWESQWERLRRNYICSQILVDGKFNVLPSDVKAGVEGLTASLSRKAFMRKQFSADAYRELSERLAYWELAELLGKRDAFKSLR